MDYTWRFYKDHENIDALLAFFETAIKEEPEELIRQIEGELQTNYVFEGINQQGRSLVAQSAITGIGEALEAVRAECVKAIRAKETQKNTTETVVVVPMINFNTFEVRTKEVLYVHEK